jgi:sec-independent protein translocase protein TatB
VTYPDDVFDIGLGELLVLGLLALLVFGPDRLPGAASSAGKFVAKARETVGQAKAQISESADLNSMQDDLQSLADLHPKRIMSSLADAPAPAPTKAAPKAASPIDPNAT